MRGNLLSVGQEGDQDEGIPGSETQGKNHEGKDLEMGEVLMNRSGIGCQESSKGGQTLCA